MKRWCKRPPALRVTASGSVNPTRSKVKRRRLAGAAQAFEGGPPEPAGRPHEVAGNGDPRWMVAAAPLAREDRTRLTGQLARTGR